MAKANNIEVVSSMSDFYREQAKRTIKDQQAFLRFSFASVLTNARKNLLGEVYDTETRRIFADSHTGLALKGIQDFFWLKDKYPNLSIVGQPHILKLKDRRFVGVNFNDEMLVLLADNGLVRVSGGELFNYLLPKIIGVDFDYLTGRENPLLNESERGRVKQILKKIKSYFEQCEINCQQLSFEGWKPPPFPFEQIRQLRGINYPSI